MSGINLDTGEIESLFPSKYSDEFFFSLVQYCSLLFLVFNFGMKLIKLDSS